MQGMSSTTSSTTASRLNASEIHHPLQDFNHHDQHHANHDDFLDQMLCNLPPSWSELQTPTNPNKSPWDLNNTSPQNPNILFNSAARDLLENQSDNNNNLQYHHDESAMLASRLRQHQISGGVGGGSQQLLLSRGTSGISGDSVVLPIPLTLGSGGDSSNGEGSVPGLFNGISRSQQFHHPPQNGSISTQNYGTATAAMNQGGGGGNGGGGGGGGAPPVRQRVRARRGQATDPHSIAERLRRERIAERMKGLQELVPNANKTDKASMLDEIIDYVKFLQLQVKVLSMSRLGGAAAVAPLVADMSSEGGGDSIQANGKGRISNGTQPASPNGNGSLTVTEHQVAKLMEEDMGSAMQYLQGKGLCLMPISLATAISTATCNPRNPKNANPFFPSTLDGPSSPSVSVLTVQSATMGNGIGEASIKDSTSVTKP